MAAQPDAPLQLPPLPADVLVEIFSRVGDAVSVVRCAATCKAWRRLIQDPSFPSLRRAALLGFFFQDTSHKSPRRRFFRRRPTRFLLLLGPSPSQLHLTRFLPTAAADLARFAPVASDGGGGLIALRRPPASSHDPVRICVCDPVAGTSTFLPPLPDPESIVFLEAGDASSFRLLAVNSYPQGQGLLLRVFSSQTGEWGTAVTAERPDNMVIHLNSPAVVHRGTVHWICGTYALPIALHTLAVRLSQSAAAVRRIALPPSAGEHLLWDACKTIRLANSGDEGSLSLVLLYELVLSVWKLEDSTARWEHHKIISLVSVFPSTTIGPFYSRRLSIEALCEKSGSLFLHAVGEGLFVLNLETERLTRVCKDHNAKYLCPYAPDLSSCIANMIKF